jgi:hypothetical protein
MKSSLFFFAFFLTVLATGVQGSEPSGLLALGFGLLAVVAAIRSGLNSPAATEVGAARALQTGFAPLMAGGRPSIGIK